MAEFHFTLGTMWSNDGKIQRIDQEDKTVLEPAVRVSGKQCVFYRQDMVLYS